MEQVKPMCKPLCSYTASYSDFEADMLLQCEADIASVLMCGAGTWQSAGLSQVPEVP